VDRELPRLTFVDIDTPMIGDDGRPRKELFLRNGLHLSDKGYTLWASLVWPHIE
jgi:lysophospholipase L1-like esterase